MGGGQGQEGCQEAGGSGLLGRCGDWEQIRKFKLDTGAGDSDYTVNFTDIIQMDGNDSPNTSCGDSILTCSKNTQVDSSIVSSESESVIVDSLTSLQNTKGDSFIVGSESDGFIVDHLTSSQNTQIDSCIDSFIVDNLTSSQNTHIDSCIDEPPWFEPYAREIGERVAVLRRIQANNRVAESAELPTLAATNARSIFPKIRNFAEDIIQRKITVSLVSETWEQAKGSKKFQAETERLFELYGLQFISCPRPSTQRGGGAAIIVDTNKFYCEKLNVMVPGKLECVWAMLRPKKVSKETVFKEIILCGFYSAPKSRKNRKLLDHIISTLHLLLTKYPNCGWVAGGDKNQLPLAPLLGALPKSRQIVTQNTHKGRKIYDILLTNMGSYYSVPYVAKAVQPDEPANGAVPSDHDCAVAEPLAGAGGTSTREYTVRSSQPFPQSGINTFGAWLHSVEWSEEANNEQDATQMALTIEARLGRQVKMVFPTKTVRVTNDDKPFISAQIKKLDKYVKKEYRMRGKSPKYLRLKSAYDETFKKAATHYLDTCVSEMMEEAPGKAYRAMKKLGARPGDMDQEDGFTLTSHIEENLTPKQSVERLADYFSKISQQYSPLDIQSLPENVRIKLEAPINPAEIPQIEVFQVWEMMKSGRKTMSSVPGELPAKLRHEFRPELAEPAALIFNKIVTSGQWPQHWKEGSAVPLKKSHTTYRRGGRKAD